MICMSPGYVQIICRIRKRERKERYGDRRRQSVRKGVMTERKELMTEGKK